MELTDELLKRAAAHVTNNLFELGDEPNRPTQRIQFIGGSILDGAETIQGGLNKRSMERVMSRLIAEAFTNKPKKIDMSVCIESGVDCESLHLMGNIEIWLPTGKLLEIKKDEFYTIVSPVEFCRPRFSTPNNPFYHVKPKGWNRCPIPEGFVIRVFGKSISEEGHICDNMSDINWSNITMFEITGIIGDYQL